MLTTAMMVLISTKSRTFLADDDGIIPVTDIDWFPGTQPTVLRNF